MYNIKEEFGIPNKFVALGYPHVYGSNKILGKSR